MASDPTATRAFRLWLLSVGIGGAGAAAAAALVEIFGHVERADWIVYVGSFLLAPLGLVAAWRAEARAPWRLQGLAVVAAAGLALLLAAVRAGFGEGGGDQTAALLVGAITLLALIASLALPGRAWTEGPSRSEPGSVLPDVLAASALLMAALYAFAPDGYVGAADLGGALLAGAAAAVVSLRVGGQELSIGAERALDVAAVILIALAALDVNGYAVYAPGVLGGTLPGDFASEIALHQNFFLGPVNQVLHGKALLVDSASQYGIGSIYFLAGWFALAPLGYGPLQVLLGLLAAAQYAVAYAILRLGGCGWLLAALAAAVAVAVTLLAAIGSPIFYPSQSGLRFLIPVVTVLVALLAARRGARAISVAVVAMVALASIWSIETFVFTLAAALALSAAEAALDGGSLRGAQKLLERDLARLALASLAAHLLFAGATRILAGEWPDYGWYLEYFTTYSSQGFQSVPAGAWSPGWLAAGVCAASLAGVAALLAAAPETARRRRSELLAIAAVSAAGAAMLTYWVGRSIDLVLPLLCLPVVMLVALWLGLVLRAAACPPPVRAWAAALGAGVAALLVLGAWPITSREWPRTALSHALPGGDSLARDLERLWDSPVIDPRAEEARRLMARHPAGSDRALVLIEPDLETEALVRDGRLNLLPLGDPAQDTVAIDHALPKVRETVAGLAPGTPMLVQEHPRGPAGPELTAAIRIHRFSALMAPGEWLVPLQLQALRLIEQRFRLVAVERGAHGLHVVRLVPRPAS